MRRLRLRTPSLDSRSTENRNAQPARGGPDGYAIAAVSDNSNMQPLIVRVAISWLTNAILLAIVVIVLDQASDNGIWSLLLAAAVFGALNTILKPLLRIVTLPLALLTFGLAWFFVSLLMLLLTDLIVSGFQIHGFWTYVAATAIVWAVNLALDLLPGPWQLTGKRRKRRRLEPER